MKTFANNTRRSISAFPTPEWTWDDFLAAAKQLTQDTDGDGRTDVYGAEQPTWDRMVIQNGGKVISEDGTRCLLGEPEAVEALTFWSELLTRHHVTPTPESKVDASVWRLFALRRLGMFVSMYPGVPILRRTRDFEWDIAVPPQGPRRRYSAFTGSAFAISRQCKNPDAAFTFVRWMTSEGMRHVMTTTGTSPVVVDSRKEPLSPMAREDRMTFWCFLSPWIVGFVLFGAGPILASILLSFTDYSLFPTLIEGS